MKLVPILSVRRKGKLNATEKPPNCNSHLAEEKTHRKKKPQEHKLTGVKQESNIKRYVKKDIN